MVEICREGRLDSYPPSLDRFARRTLEIAGENAGLGAEHEISLLLCDGSAMRSINRHWRGKDKSTNVLSFPARDLRPGQTPPRGPLGDIAVALPVARREAREKGEDFRRYLALLLIHGLLHLMGHDHNNDGEAEAMESEERRLLELAWRS